MIETGDGVPYKGQETDRESSGARMMGEITAARQGYDRGIGRAHALLLSDRKSRRTMKTKSTF